MSEREREPVLDPEYWRRRMQTALARGEIHRAVFNGSVDQFAPIEAENREALREIGPEESILDVGCGYGRLLDLMPKSWRGGYLGVDLSPDLIGAARIRWPDRRFVCADARMLDLYVAEEFDWAVAISVRAMVERHAGAGVWEQIEAVMKRLSRRQLILTYGEHD